MGLCGKWGKIGFSKAMSAGWITITKSQVMYCSNFFLSIIRVFFCPYIHLNDIFPCQFKIIYSCYNIKSDWHHIHTQSSLLFLINPTESIILVTRSTLYTSRMRSCKLLNTTSNEQNNAINDCFLGVLKLFSYHSFEKISWFLMDVIVLIFLT